MCVYVCERKRERERERDTLMNNTRWGMSNYIKLALSSSSSSNTKIPTMRYMISCARVHMCEENIGTRV